MYIPAVRGRSWGDRIEHRVAPPFFSLVFFQVFARGMIGS